MNHAASTTPGRRRDQDSIAEQFLATKARAIRALAKNVVRDVIEIGRLLAEAKEHCGHGHWLPWLDQEFGWSQDTAERFMSLHGLQGQIPQIAEYDIPVSGLYLLARRSTSEEARTEVLDRAAKGERLSHEEVKNIVATAKTATTTDTPVLASSSTVGDVRKRTCPGSSIDPKGRRQPQCERPASATTTNSAREFDSPHQELAYLLGRSEATLSPDACELFGRLLCAYAERLDDDGVEIETDDIGQTSSGEIARLNARVEELERENKRLSLALEAAQRAAEFALEAAQRAGADDAFAIPAFLRRGAGP